MADCKNAVLGKRCGHWVELCSLKENTCCIKQQFSEDCEDYETNENEIDDDLMVDQLRDRRAGAM